MRLRSLLPLLLLFSLQLQAQTANLLPRPKLCQTDGSFCSVETLRIDCDTLAALRSTAVAECGVVVDDSSPHTLRVRRTVNPKWLGRPTDEGYRIVVDNDLISIEASGLRGEVWAMRTLGRLICNRTIERCEIIDWPAFDVRGIMHDTGRDFIPVEQLEEQIDRLSRFKINTFHWHLTENEAWRLQIERYPQLTAPTNMTRREGLCYSHADVKRVIEFCRVRGVSVVPEIDVPGHSAAFVRAFGCPMQSEQGIAILQNIFDEVCDLFDSDYIHIGTDEVQFTMPDFVPRIVGYIRSKGRKVVSWNPGWNYRSGEVDALHLWSYRGQSHDSIPFVDSKFLYANHFDVYSDPVGIYLSRVCNRSVGGDDALGEVVAFWNDRALRSCDDIVAQNQLYLSAVAAAARAWQGGGYEYFDRCGVVLPDRLDSSFADYADFERRFVAHLSTTLDGCAVAYTPQCDVRWRVTDPFPNGGDIDASFPPEFEDSESYNYRGKEYGTQLVTGKAVVLRHVWGSLVPAVIADPRPNSTVYCRTFVWSPADQKVGALIETQNYSRSESDIPPRQGCWDWRGSRLWLNGAAIEPPIWQSTHSVRSATIPLTNENLAARPPIELCLQRGWNEVLVKLPVAEFSTPEVRLQKWGFTFALVDSAGRSVDNIVWSPDRNDFAEQTVCGYPDGEGYCQGVSAAFAGFHNGMIVVAGGCNFPDRSAAEGGAKRYYSDIYVARPTRGALLEWHRAGSLPVEAAYGVSIQTTDGIVCAGGMNATGSLSSVWRLSWRDNAVVVEQLPSLPAKVDNASGCAADGKLFIAGGNVDGLPSTALFGADRKLRWHRLSDFPAPPRTQPVCFAAVDGSGRSSLFVAGGFAPAFGGSAPTLSTDMIRYDLRKKRWSEAADPQISFGGGVAVALAGVAVVAGGVDRNIFLEALQRSFDLSVATDSALRDSLSAQSHRYMRHERHWYRFNDRLMIYRPDRCEWVVAGRSDRLSRAGASAVATPFGIYIMGGESKPGIRTTSIVRIAPLTAEEH